MRRVIGFCLTIAGLVLIFYPQIEKITYDREQQILIDSFGKLGETEFVEQVVTGTEKTGTVERLLDYSVLRTEVDSSELRQETVSNELSEEEQDLFEGIRGIIRIKSINLEMAIFGGASPENLMKGIGIVEPKKQIGVNNIGLAGHRAIARGKQFNRLDEIEEGDAIDIQTRDGVYEFIVTRTFVVHKSDVTVLEDEDEPFVTLVTCTPLGLSNPPDRLIVQAKLIKK